MREIASTSPCTAMGRKTPLSPEPEDGLVIREVPDIFVTGHVHGHECLDFRGPLCLFKHMAGPNILPTHAGFPTQTLHVDNHQSQESQINFDSVCLSLVTSRVFLVRFVTSYPDEGKQHQNQHDQGKDLQGTA